MLIDVSLREFKSRLPHFMIIKKADRKEFKNSERCIVYEYPLKENGLNVAFVEINGRYPDEGCVVNEKVKEIVFVAGGSGMLTVDGKPMKIAEGDAILILPKQKFFYDGKIKLLTACSPSWYPEQHKAVK
jgi:mannose-6-phosphate isomerase-like protein (cupin superfamily)